MGKKGPRCSVCDHAEKWRIELLRAGGASLDSLAEKFKPLSRDAIHRHWHNCVTADAKAGYLAGPSQMEALHAKAAAEGESVIDFLRITRTALMSSLAACSEAGDARGVAMVSNSLVGVLERMAKITGELSALAGSTINVTNIINSPIFARLQAAQLRALAAYPEARAATVAAWRELESETADTPAKPKAPIVIEHVPTLPPCPVGLP
ncbi:hypothetical protein V5279_25240 [Bradyrhizobium sp. 26S5]|uniref:hypothetical protein n=1 Tax=Bradyrhizobium sp. 26S5 TaxID=3139729 RepID=UPI0030CF893B